MIAPASGNGRGFLKRGVERTTAHGAVIRRSAIAPAAGDCAPRTVGCIVEATRDRAGHTASDIERAATDRGVCGLVDRAGTRIACVVACATSDGCADVESTIGSV